MSTTADVISELEAFLVRHVEAGTVALRGGRNPEVVAAGVASLDGDPMRDDAIIRIQSMTKAITSVAAPRLVEAGRIELDQSLGMRCSLPPSGVAVMPETSLSSSPNS